MDTATTPIPDPISILVDLAARRRTARIVYKKPAETDPTERLVEPYSLQARGSALLVQCWQVQPAPEGVFGWRWFRVDRILAASDGGSEFQPRAKITLDTGEVHARRDIEILIRAGDASDAVAAETARRNIGGPISEYPATAQARKTRRPTEEYQRFLEKALLDGRFDQRVMDEAEAIGFEIEDEYLRAVHGRVFVSVLQEVLMDGKVTEKEAKYLASVRRVLKKLGWAP
jgi:predicted DNA-binding transcriptional regulator YafY